jgi:LacI family transcriptional regulator
MSVTMTDVARAAGVSPSTVSHVINGTRFVEAGTHGRVQRVIDQLGYRQNHLARAVARGGPTQSIGVAISARSNPYFGAVLSAIDDEVTKVGSTLLLGETGEDVAREFRLVNSLLERRVDGIILAPGPGAEADTLPLLERSSTPTVLVDRMQPGQLLDQIGTDNAEPMARLVDHLAVVHGHRRIGLISGLPGLSTTDERVAGYRRGLLRNGCDDEAALIAVGASSSDQGEVAAAQLLDGPGRDGYVPPTALIAGNNAMTVGTLRLLRQRGVDVPRDMAVASFDDFEWAELLASPLTSIAQDWTAIGRRAVTLLAERLEDPGRPVVVERVATSLVLRNSCGCTGPNETIQIPVTEE